MVAHMRLKVKALPDVRPTSMHLNLSQGVLFSFLPLIVTNFLNRMSK